MSKPYDHSPEGYTAQVIDEARNILMRLEKLRNLLREHGDEVKARDIADAIESVEIILD